MCSARLKDRVERSSRESAGETTEDTVCNAMVSLSTSGHTGVGNKGCRLAIVPVQIKHTKENKIIQTYEFLYTGSSATFCTEKVVRPQRQGKENGHSVKDNGTEETSGLLQNKWT